MRRSVKSALPALLLLLFAVVSTTLVGSADAVPTEERRPTSSADRNVDTEGGFNSSGARTSEQASNCKDQRLIAAQTLADAGLFDIAQAMIDSLLLDTDIAPCAAEAMVALERQKKAAAGITPALIAGLHASTQWIFWVLGLAYIIFVIGILGIVWRICSSLIRRGSKARWRITRITDDTSLGIAEAWQSALNEVGTKGELSLGLLSREIAPIPQVLIIGGGDRSDLSTLVANAPDIRGVSTSWLASLLISIMRRLRSRRRTIEVNASTRDKTAVLRLSIINAQNRRYSTAMAATWESEAASLSEIDKMAAQMATRTSYMLAGAEAANQVDARVRLHDGIERLNTFLAKYESGALAEAAQAFLEARRLEPENMNAALYEGITRELMEDHERAASLFQLVLDRTKPKSPIRSRAQYNLAMSYLRRYTANDLERATSILKSLINDEGAEPPELRYFACAGLANVLSHKFLFWNEFEPRGSRDFDSWSEDKKKEKLDKLKNWSDEINGLIEETRDALSTLKKFKEDLSARTQLEWLMQNARGNHALNRAKNAAKPAGIEDDVARKQVLEEALTAFRRCEALMAAGVETLTNIATTLLALGRPTEAIEYTKQARSLNAAYEYAYYREAQAHMALGEIDNCRELLSEATRALARIKIAGFRKIFDELGVGYHGG